MDLFYKIISSPIGQLLLEANQSALKRIQFEPFTKSENEKSNAVLEETARQLHLYFAGERKEFDLPLEAEGTDFQKNVWQALLQIPFGRTASYKDIARLIKNEKAVRAVGMANNRNPLPIVVPCHRIIGVNGKLVGYAGEIWRKEWLLKHERIMLF